MPGAQPALVEVQGWQVGISICYDLRFPELYRTLSQMGAEVFVVPAAFTYTTGKDHWHPLLRARAIEGQSWVIAAAQWGKHPQSRQTYGHSMVIDPWGTIVAEAPEEIAITIADLDPAVLTRVRESLPSLKHRRL
jgi:predicted amidohydrolase